MSSPQRGLLVVHGPFRGVELEPRAVEWLRRFSRLSAAILAALGIAVVTGWALDFERLRSLVPGMAPMTPNSALAFALAGWALSEVASARAATGRARAAAAAWGIVAIGASTLIEHLARLDLGIDALLILAPSASPEATIPLRMTPPTALAFVFLGAALLLVGRGEERRGHRAGEALAILAGLPGLLAFTGYAYGVDLLPGASTLHTMAMPSAIAFGLASIATLTARPERGIAAVVASRGPGGEAARRLFPFALLLPLIDGALHLAAVRSGLFSQAHGFALVATALEGVAIGFVFWIGVRLMRSDAARRKAEAALQESLLRARLAEQSERAIVDNATLGIYRSTMDGRFLRVNPALVRLLGYDSDAELLEVAIPSLYCDPAARAGILERFLSQGLREGVEVEWRRRDGSPIALRLAGRVIEAAAGVAGVFEVFAQDVTERRRAEAELRRSAERLRLLVEGMQTGFWDWDLGTDRVQYSREWKQLLGYEEDEVGGDLGEWRRLTHPDDVEATLAKVREFLARPEGYFETEFRMRHKRGDYRWIRSRAAAQFAADGTPNRMLGIHHDVTEQRSLEEQLRRSQRMESLGRLAGGVAHDFNNYLGVVAGYAELVRAQLEPASPLRGWVDEIVFAAGRAAGVTRQLLAFGRKQIVNPQPLDLKQALEESGGLLRRLIGENIELELRVPDDVGRVVADRVLFEQVVVNLAVNARDAMPEGGRLVLAAENVEIVEAYAALHPGVAPGRYVALAVTDTGTGMDAATLGQIFEPFFTTKEPGKGTGLGLATVYGIDRQSGGQVTVYSEVGRGTTFRVYLPRTEAAGAAASPRLAAPADSPAAAQRDAEGLPGAPEAVLLVEDDDALRRVAAMMLRAAGFEVLDAGDPETARARAAQDGHRLRLLVTDVMLRGGSGPDLAQELGQMIPDLRVLFVSGYADHERLQGRGLSSRQAFLAKPFGAAELRRAARALLDARGE